MAATLGAGPRGEASFTTTLSAFRAVFNKGPSARLQFLLEGLNELHGFAIRMNDDGVLIQVAPRQHGNSVKSVLPLHITPLALEFEDPGDRQFRSCLRAVALAPAGKSKLYFATETRDNMRSPVYRRHCMEQVGNGMSQIAHRVPAPYPPRSTTLRSSGRVSTDYRGVGLDEPQFGV